MNEELAWRNYRWAWSLRGVTHTEHLICLRLADQASETGLIDHLRHQRLANEVNLTRDGARKAVYSLIKKGFIKERRAQYRTSGDQTANAYQINLRQFHPPDPAGAALWKWTLDGFKDGHKHLATAVDIHSENSTAFYEEVHRLLSVWLNAKQQVTFFESHRDTLLKIAGGNPRRLSLIRFQFISL